MNAGELRYENFIKDLIAKNDGKIHLIVGHGNIVGLCPKIFYEEEKENYEMYEVNYTCISIYGATKNLKTKVPAFKKGYQLKYGWKEVFLSYGEHVGYGNGEILWDMEKLNERKTVVPVK